jgi:hypothetical protein
MHSVGDETPTGDLFRGVDARHIRVTVGLNTDRRGLGNVQTCGRTLAVVLGVRPSRNASWGAHTAQRRHDDPVGKGKNAEPESFEEDVGGHELKLSD